MPCHVPATSVSCRRRALYQKRPPTIVAKLDLASLVRPGRKIICAALRREKAFWRPLGIRRHRSALLIAVEWLGSQSASDRYSVVTLSLTEHALSWRKYPSAKAAKTALAAVIDEKADDHA